uniref:Uncharacterized protein n=1 Tax=Picea glauca TaxID=3330 RepID=A0A124GNM5_PICGL|nr:hypothetical protein ABT39_MTgene3832 [Picea glauca]
MNPNLRQGSPFIFDPGGDDWHGIMFSPPGGSSGQSFHTSPPSCFHTFLFSGCPPDPSLLDYRVSYGPSTTIVKLSILNFHLYYSFV